ncbi:YbaY family lipoprotein [Aeromicrobium sp.]|uniref:YbaY family lipoprotein n=1 Tax=Aeromicrobium sp. TaxID=1871063 RepID=UPI0028AF5E34|nr:YbaY family lipoprotein [Aeromicrobium sp.]
MSVLTVSGSLSVRDQIEIVADAVATVKVVDHEGEVLGATAVHVEELPAEFSVSIDPDLVAGDLFVWAFLRNGGAGWGTLELVPADVPSIELTRIEL